MIGNSAELLGAVSLGIRVSTHPSLNVLLRGETGTGKELFALGIHYAGANFSEPFVPINCAAIPENLLESELFGHERGAFTSAHAEKKGLLELAGSGTIFLDEVGEMPLNLQPKLLRVLEDRRIRRVGGIEEREISCRVIAATNRELADAVAEGQFRGDLYYRLGVFQIDIPSLREREGDIELLADHFVETLAREHGREVKRLSRGAKLRLLRHTWPGNVRELKNTMDRAMILADGPMIEPQDIVIHENNDLAGEAAADWDTAGTIVVPTEGLSLEEAERQLLEITLQITGGNQTRAARIMGVSRPTIIRKMRRYGLA